MRSKTFFTVAALALMGALAFAQNVTYDFDKGADFSRFKTYSWIKGTILSDELNHKRVVNAIDTQLAGKGLRKIDSNVDSDVLVAYHATFDKDVQITGFSSGFGPYRFGGTRTGTARAEEILVGTLAVDVVDAKSKMIVWRGIATKEVDVKASPDKREKNINRAAEKIFKNYPPASR
jgi:hypothetical protein